MENKGLKFISPIPPFIAIMPISLTVQCHVIAGNTYIIIYYILFQVFNFVKFFFNALWYLLTLSCSELHDAQRFNELSNMFSTGNQHMPYLKMLG